MMLRRSSSVHAEILNDEVCLYDWASKHVHALNATAARVWQMCDGRTPPAQMVESLRADLGVSAEEIVWLALADLKEKHLIEGDLQLPRSGTVSRRDLLVKLGATAAMLPVITSIVAPAALEAASSNLTVTYNGNGSTGGSVPVDNGLYVTGATVTVKANTGSLVKTGSAFAGWNTAANGSGSSYAATGSATFIMGAANVTLFAQWTPTTQTLIYTGAAQTFAVPAGVTSVTVDVSGAQGGRWNATAANALGGRVVATIAVTAGESLTVNVGGKGGDSRPGNFPNQFIAGGFNGGGDSNGDGGSGGGASDVRRGSTKLVVAGGAGGTGGAGSTGNAGTGGAGGGTTGGAGGTGGAVPGGSGGQGGGGGTQTAGGTGGVPGSGATGGTAGTAVAGGTGGPGRSSATGLITGGGGGGGYFGGGGGGGGFAGDGGGGGGGSSYTDPAVTSVTLTQGVRAGDGQVVLSW